jgi:methylmalonyl-CoA mutase N-terminal domain/subunit
VGHDRIRSRSGKERSRLKKKKPTKFPDIRRAQASWKRNRYTKALEACVPPRAFTTVSGKTIKELYTPADLPGFDYLRDLNFPGEYPFTRGIHPTMHRGRPWTMRQFSGFGTAEDTNKRYKYLLAHGQTGLSVAFHLPTLMGVDSDHPLAKGEVGKCGVAIASAASRSIRSRPR